MKEIILATSNPGKIAEFETLLSPWHCISQSSLGLSEIKETGLSFIENAILKARHASSFSHKPALADDSGLVVPALKGAPGIYSARFAGTMASASENIHRLLSQLENTPESERQAYFYCALALVKGEEDPTPLIATGQWFGKIALQAMGTEGFGYDPVFYLEQYQCTAAQLPAQLKNTLSHRAQALKALRLQLNFDDLK